MKISDNISYPYPIWGWNNNYKIDRAKSKIEANHDKDNFVFDITIFDHEKVIDSLISENKACYACIVTCSDTFVTKYFSSKNSSFSVVIPRDSVSKNVNMKFMIVATEIISDYHNEQLDDFYEGQAYIPKGAMLALIAEGNFEATPCGGKRVGDIIKVVENTTGSEISYDEKNPRILISLPTEQFEIFCKYGALYKSVLHSTVAYQALLRGVCELYRNLGNDYEWVSFLKNEIEKMETIDRSIDSLTEDNNFTIEEATEIVDNILKNPTQKAFNNILEAEIRNQQSQ